MRDFRVAIDCRMYLSSGIGVYLQNLLPRLAQTISEDRLTLLGSRSVADQLAARLPGAELRILKSRIYTVQEQLELTRHARGGKGVWWSPHFNIPLGCTGNLVVTVHDLFHLHSSEIRRNPLKLGYARVMFGAIRRRARKIICVSRFTASELERLVGARPGQVEVIPNGLDESWSDPICGPRPQENPYFLFVGNLKPNKNVQGLMRAFALISERVPHDLVIVGQKSGFITGDRGAEQLAEAIGPRVKFAGSVQLEELRRWYRYASALVFPSFYEGFGFPPLEAMAVQCPAIVSQAASLPEVCGDAALYCDPGDAASVARAMLRIVEDRPLREQLVTRGLARIEKFRWSQAAARTAQVLASAAQD